MVTSRIWFTAASFWLLGQPTRLLLFTSVFGSFWSDGSDWVLRREPKTTTNGC